MSTLLDAKEDGFKKGKFQTFEISNLMGLGPRLSTPVLLYLFYKIQSQRLLIMRIEGKGYRNLFPVSFAFFLRKIDIL